MSIQNNFPALKPTLLLDFANTEELDPRITFTRASTATYYGTQTAVAEQNGLLQSQDFATTWTVNNTVVASNTTTAPDGTGTADTITENTVSSFHVVSQTGLANLSNTVGTMTLSVFAKLGTGTRYFTIGLSTDITTNNGSATFDLSTGTNTQTQNNGTWTSASATITAVAQGFYRCTLTVTTDSVGAGAVRIGLNNTSTPTTANRGFGADYVGDGTSSVIIWGAQVEKRSAASAYTPTTTQPIINYIPVLETAASGVARFDHNPTTFESLGLLIEEQRTNLILQSEDLDTTWTETRATLSLNSVVAPNGALTADRLIASADNNTHFSSQTFTGTAASHTFTVYAKASGLNHVALRLFNGTSQVGLAYYNLSTGATGTDTAGPAAITSVGNGYCRCSLTATLAASASCTADIQLANADNTNSFIGNAFDGVTLWGTQVELGAFATSYIPTVASQVTRAADAASMTGTNFSSWYNQTEGTFFAQFTPAVSNFGINRNIFMASDGTTANSVGVRYGSSGSQPSLSVITASTNQAILVTGAMIAGTSYKLAGAYKANDFAVSRDAGTVGTDISGTVPVVTQAEIGMLAGTSFSTQTIKKLAYYPLRVTNAQLQALTS